MVDIYIHLWFATGMETVETLSAALKAMTLAERQRVADAAGVPVATVQKIAIGQTRNPRFNTVSALDAAIKQSIGGSAQ